MFIINPQLKNKKTAIFPDDFPHLSNGNSLYWYKNTEGDIIIETTENAENICVIMQKEGFSCTL